MAQRRFTLRTKQYRDLSQGGSTLLKRISSFTSPHGGHSNSLARFARLSCHSVAPLPSKANCFLGGRTPHSRSMLSSGYANFMSSNLRAQGKGTRNSFHASIKHAEVVILSGLGKGFEVRYPRLFPRVLESWSYMFYTTAIARLKEGHVGFCLELMAFSSSRLVWPSF